MNWEGKTKRLMHALCANGIGFPCILGPLLLQTLPQLQPLLNDCVAFPLAHSVLAVLFDPKTRRIAGLEPCHFISIATPHVGCDAEGISQVGLLI
eukprot:scaffold137675_cov18-Tisochrysis_lutea.AAC.1